MAIAIATKIKKPPLIRGGRGTVLYETLNLTERGN